MTEFNFDLVLLNLEKEEIKDQDEKKITLKTVCVNALLGDTKGLSGEKKLDNFKLAERLYKGGKIDLTVKETNDLLNTVKTAHTPLIVGNVCRMIDPEKKKEKKGNKKKK